MHMWRKFMLSIDNILCRQLVLRTMESNLMHLLITVSMLCSCATFSWPSEQIKPYHAITIAAILFYSNNSGYFVHLTRWGLPNSHAWARRRLQTNTDTNTNLRHYTNTNLRQHTDAKFQLTALYRAPQADLSMMYQQFRRSMTSWDPVNKI
jgi:hypothetical protein